MTTLTRDDFRKLREECKRAATLKKEQAKTVSVIIGMGTCGIAAGAKAAFDAFTDELAKSQVSQVAVRQTGCMGLCHSEPTVEVRMHGMPDTVYGCVTAEVARKIVQEHIRGGRLVDGHIYDKPAADLVPTLTAGRK